MPAMALRSSFGALVVLLHILSFCVAELQIVDAGAFEKRRRLPGVFVASCEFKPVNPFCSPRP